MGIADVGTSGVQWASMWGLAAEGGKVKLQIRRSETGHLSEAPPGDVLRLNENQLNWMMSEEGRKMLARYEDDDEWRDHWRTLRGEEEARRSSLGSWRAVEALEREEEIARHKKKPDAR